MLTEDRGSPHRFNEILEEFPKDIHLDKFLFQDESLLWAQKLPLRYRFRSLGVMLCLICASFFLLLDIIILAVDRSALGMIVACLPLPLIVLPLRYAIHRLTGSHIQVVTNYRVMQCTVKLRSFFIRSLSFHVISGIVVKDSTIEFSIKEFDGTMNKKSSELRSMVFRGVTTVNRLETLVQRQLNTSLTEFQYPPNIETAVRVDTLPHRYREMLPQLGIDPSAVPAHVSSSPPPSPRGEPPPQLLWISSLSFLEAHRSVIVNTLLFEAWAACIYFSPSLVQPSILSDYLPPLIVLMLAIPLVMVLFNYLRRVDVLTSHAMAFFYVGLRICNYGARMETLSYKESFPHICEININDGSGIITFENIPPKGLSFIKWPDVLVREEFIFRKHCLAYMNNSA